MEKSDILKIVGFVLAAVFAVAAVYIPAAAPALNTLSGGVLGWLGLRRPGDEKAQ